MWDKRHVKRFIVHSSQPDALFNDLLQINGSINDGTEQPLCSNLYQKHNLGVTNEAERIITQWCT